MPKLMTTIPTPQPLDPAKKTQEHLELQQSLPPFAQQAQKQMALLEGELTRLEAQIATMTQRCSNRRYQLQHLAAYLKSLADAQEG